MAALLIISFAADVLGGERDRLASAACFERGQNGGRDKKRKDEATEARRRNVYIVAAALNYVFLFTHAPHQVKALLRFRPAAASVATKCARPHFPGINN